MKRPPSESEKTASIPKVFSFGAVLAPANPLDFISDFPTSLLSGPASPSTALEAFADRGSRRVRRGLLARVSKKVCWIGGEKC